MRPIVTLRALGDPFRRRLRHEVADCLLGVEPDLGGVGADEPAREMPPGRRATSFSSSASSALTEILVVSAISRSESCCASRAARSRDPRSVGMPNCPSVGLDMTVRIGPATLGDDAAEPVESAT